MTLLLRMLVDVAEGVLRQEHWGVENGLRWVLDVILLINFLTERSYM